MIENYLEISIFSIIDNVIKVHITDKKQVFQNYEIFSLLFLHKFYSSVQCKLNV